MKKKKNNQKKNRFLKRKCYFCIATQVTAQMPIASKPLKTNPLIRLTPTTIFSNNQQSHNTYNDGKRFKLHHSSR